mmetsp:Transcript_25290/g.71333  ORF Transcript_25290/g.71333 Transcript_25290/m.71333 type:complete len:233 (-) Transcript_25290:7-705(-)
MAATACRCHAACHCRSKRKAVARSTPPVRGLGDGVETDTPFDPARPGAASHEKRGEFAVVELAILVLVELLDEALDLDGHPELVLDNGYKTLGVDEARLVRGAAQRHEGVQGVELILEFLGPAPLLLKGPQEFRELDLAGPVLVDVGHEAEKLLLAGRLADGLEQQLHLLRVDGAAAVLVEGVEGLAAFLDELLVEHHRPCSGASRGWGARLAAPQHSCPAHDGCTPRADMA